MRVLWLATGILLSTSVRAQDAFQVHGFLQGRFTNEEGTPDQLEIRRARLIFSGEPWSGLSYKFQVDFAKTPYLMDASLAWRFSPAFALAAGQMKIPFSAESILSDDRNGPVARSRAVLALSPGRDTGVQGRDTGLAASGTFLRHGAALVEYAAGVFRGQTLIDAPKVHYRATAGRLLMHPVRGLTLGVDGYGSFHAASGFAKRREGAEAGYNRGRFEARAEQIWARDAALHRRGGYLLGVWRISPEWDAVARADWLTANAQKPATSSIAYVAGANRYLFRHVKIGMDAGAQRDQGPKGWSSVFFAQVMPYF